jgi:replicative DNA helicase Mcm
MAVVDDQHELIEQFQEFYRTYYRDEIGDLAQAYPNEQKSLYLDWRDLYQFNADLASDYLEQPEQIREYAEEALRLYDLPVDVKLGGAHVRLIGLDDRTDIRAIRSEHVNRMLSVAGIVRKATSVRPKMEMAAFECQRCGTLTRIPQTDTEFQEPHECEGCERQGPFALNTDQSEFVDSQKLRIQESPEGLRGGETPESIDVHVEDDICGAVTPGDHVVITGVLRLEQQGSGNDASPIFDVYMEGDAIEIEDEEFEDMDISEADKQEIVALSQEDDLYERMVDSIAPSIYGYRQEKLAMLLQLFSGVTKHLPDGSRVRGDLHMLLIGDPGTGKCVSGDTQVVLGDGRRVQIQSLVENNLTNPTPADDGVWDTAAVDVVSADRDGQVGTRPVTRVWRRTAPDTMYRIDTASGRTLDVTPSHPLFVASSGRLAPAEAESLREGTAIASISDQLTVATDGGTAVQQSCSVRIPADDISWDRIGSIESYEPDDEWVYDLEVADTHAYVSNGIISHNSQLLQYVQNIAPRSVYTSGKGSSSAGLTAAAVKDDFGDGQQWSLEAGALVLADQGIAAVDELDKMNPDDRSAMHEALEQQSYHPSTELLTADGRREEIGALVDDAMADAPDAVVDGVDCEILPTDDLSVHTVDMETNAVEKVPVDRVSRHEAPDEFVRVTFSNGREVTVTPEHPMFVADDGVETTPAADIEPGAFVPAPRKLPNSAAPVSLADEEMRPREAAVELPDDMTPDLAEFLGLLVAEGHSYAVSAHEIGLSNQDERLLARADWLAGELFGIESTGTTNAAGTVTKRWISTKLYRWFESNLPELMATARNKRIPTAVLGASEEDIRRFLVGAFAGDGGVETESLSYSTASEGLAEDYADALSKVGVATRIHHDSSEDSWKVYVTGDSLSQFVDSVVDPADDRYEDAQGLAERSEDTLRHHDVLPTESIRELRSLHRTLGVPLTGDFDQHRKHGYGVQVETVRDTVEQLRKRLQTVRDDLGAADTLRAIRSAIGWSQQQLADQLAATTRSTVDYAERGGYDADRRAALRSSARRAVASALDEAADRLDALETRCGLRYYRVTDVETVPNEGEHACEWVYDVTVEPTNTFVSKGVVLHNSVSIAKAGINATLKSRCSLLGAANPKYGRFDEYEPIGEQIDLEPALISRFDLIFTVTDEPDEEKDRNLADHILQTNYAGELHTQQTEMASANFSESTVETATESVDPDIDAELLRKYVAYARRQCYPAMTEGAREAIQEFYVDLRSDGTDEDAAVPVTARKLEALVRLAEASARMRLSDYVEQQDSERAITIVRSCLEDIGVDPETGELDADFIETGTTKSQRDRIRTLKALIEELEPDYDDGVPIDDLYDRAAEIDMEQSKVEHEIDKLKQKGEVYEPRTDHLRTT